MTLLYGFLLLAALTAILSAEKVDQAFHGEKVLQKVLLVFGGGTILVCFIGMTAHFWV